MLRDKTTIVNKVLTETIDGKIYLVLDSNKYNSPAVLSSFQEKLIPYSKDLTTIWWSIWTITLLYLIYTYIFKRLFIKDK